MKKSRFTDNQISEALKRIEPRARDGAASAAALCHGTPASACGDDLRLKTDPV